MRSLTSAAPILLAIAVAAGCPAGPVEPHKGKTRTIALHIEPAENGAGIEIAKDRDHHESAIVAPGDQVHWVCANCPPGSEFAVEDLHFVGDLDDIVDALLDNGLTDPDNLALLIEELESMRKNLAPLEEEAPVAEQPIGKVITALKRLRVAVTPGDVPQPALFAEWSAPDLVRGRETLESPRVAALTRAGVWKFTWKVQLEGDVKTWDPHIIGHPDRGSYFASATISE